MTLDDDSRRFALRITALTSSAAAEVAAALSELGETTDEAAEALAGTCWTEDLPRPWTAARITAHVREIVARSSSS